MPENMRYVWDYYLELSFTRQNYGWGISPLTYAEILAWSKLRGIFLDAWELDILVRLDAVYMTVEAEADKKRRALNGG